MSERQNIGASVKDKLSQFSNFLLGKHGQKNQGGESSSQTKQTDIADKEKTDPGSRLQEGRASRGPFGAK
jgi:hypothetical protein